MKLGEKIEEGKELMEIANARSTVLCCCRMGLVLRSRSWCFCSWEVLLVLPDSDRDGLSERGLLTKADFGTWRPNILIALSFVAWGIGFGWLGVHEPEKWQIAAGMYIVGRKYNSACLSGKELGTDERQLLRIRLRLPSGQPRKWLSSI